MKFAYLPSSAFWLLTPAFFLMYMLDFLFHIIHQQVLPEGIRGGEVGLAAANFRHLLDKADEAVILRQHKGVDQDAVAAAARYLVQGFRHYQGIKPEGVLVNPPVIQCERGRLAVRDHHDL